MIIDEVGEFEDLIKEAGEIREPEKAADVIKRGEYIIKMKKKGIINKLYYQGKFFCKKNVEDFR